MGRKEKKAYLTKIRIRYLEASKAKKGSILDEMCASGLWCVLTMIRGVEHGSRVHLYKHTYCAIQSRCG